MRDRTFLAHQEQFAVWIRWRIAGYRNDFGHPSTVRNPMSPACLGYRQPATKRRFI